MAVINRVYFFSIICVFLLKIDVSIQKFPGTPEQDSQVTNAIISLSKLLVDEDKYRKDIETALTGLLDLYREKSPEKEIPAEVHNLYYSEQDDNGTEIYGKWLYGLRDVATLFNERFSDVEIQV